MRPKQRSGFVVHVAVANPVRNASSPDEALRVLHIEDVRGYPQPAIVRLVNVRIAMGTDGNRPWGPHEEMADMVAAGMTPMQVIVASPRNGSCG
jgi:hypothetical protein